MATRWKDTEAAAWLNTSHTVWADVIQPASRIAAKARLYCLNARARVYSFTAKVRTYTFKAKSA